MFGGFSVLIALAQVVAAVVLLVIVVALIIMHPLAGFVGLFWFGLLCSRVVHHLRRVRP